MTKRTGLSYSPLKRKTPLKRSTKPLTRSMKPLERTAIKRQGKRGKRKAYVMREAKRKFFAKFHLCQYCYGQMATDDCHIHHKLKRSLNGGDEDENLVAVHGSCHQKIHAERSNYLRVRDSTANITNGDLI